MANVLVHIELADQRPSPRSLAALRTGRRAATRLGATLHAVVPRRSLPQAEEESLLAQLSEQGADRVVWVTHPSLSTPSLHATHGQALLAAHERYPAQLILLPGSEGSRDIGPRLALEIGGHYTGEARVQQLDRSLSYQHTLQRRRYAHTQDLLMAPRPLVLGLGGQIDTGKIGTGSGPAQVTDLQLETLTSPLDVITTAGAANATSGPTGPGPTQSRSTRERLTLGAGGGLSARGFALLRDLARVTNAELVASRTACERGIAPADLLVGIDARGIDTEVYLAFASSGSESHLAAIAPGTTLLAINSDEAAPIFEVADYGLVADAEQTIEQLIKYFDSPASSGDER